MARPIADGRELSWHKASKRWYRTIGGKPVYFGYGKGKSDTASYNKAVRAYKQHLKEEAQKEMNDKVVQAILDRDLGDVLGVEMKGDLRLSPDQDWLPVSRNEDGVIQLPSPEESKEWLAGELRKMVARANTSSEGDSKRPTTALDKLVGEFDAEQIMRYRMTQANPEALSPKQRLSGGAYRDSMRNVRLFAEYAISNNLDNVNDEDTAGRLLISYRKHLEDKLLDKELSPSTVNKQLCFAKMFVKWLYENHHIKNLPRNLDKATKQYAVTAKAITLPIETIQEIWKAADGRMKCLIALALNLGAYAIEIASIKSEHVIEECSYIAKYRNKTGVPYKTKLWPVTAKLIAEHRDDLEKETGGLLFITRKGQPLVHDGLKGKTDSIAQALKKLCKKINVKATWSQFRDTAATELEKIATNGDGQADSTLVSQFLAHADQRTAKYYIESEPVKLERSKLDDAVMQLCKVFDLKPELLQS